jgi:hypothetical protein
MVELRGLRSKTRLDISQTLSIGQLGEHHAQILIETREALDLVLPGVARRAGLDASIDSAAGTAVTVREGESMFKSRHRKYATFRNMFNNLNEPSRSTLGHYRLY